MQKQQRKNSKTCAGTNWFNAAEQRMELPPMFQILIDDKPFVQIGNQVLPGWLGDIIIERDGSISALIYTANGSNNNRTKHA